MTQDDMGIMLKRKVPGVSNIRITSESIYSNNPEVSFKYKNYVFHIIQKTLDKDFTIVAVFDGNNSMAFETVINLENKLEDMVNTKDIEDVKKITKEIRSTATKLSKKKLSLKEAVENNQYYQDALRDWPKGIEQIKNITKEIRNKSTKLPKKKLKLEDWIDG